VFGNPDETRSTYRSVPNTGSTPQSDEAEVKQVEQRPLTLGAVKCRCSQTGNRPEMGFSSNYPELADGEGGDWV